MTDTGDLHDRRAYHAELPDGVNPIGVPDDDAEYRSFVVALAAIGVFLVLCTTVGWIAFNHFASS